MWLQKVTALLVLVLALPIQGQEANGDRKRFVVVPPENLLLVVASQPDCALAFDNAQLLTSADGDGTWGATYQLRNRGTKPIKTFTAALWTSWATGGTLRPKGKVKSGLLLPGQTVQGDKDTIVNLTDSLREKLNLGGPMRAIAVLMIEKIEFADGSIYDARTTSQALLDYFANQSDKERKAIGRKSD